MVPAAKPSDAKKVYPTDCTVLRCGVEERMAAVLQINVALWGMLICSGMEMAGWLQNAF
jgi:hypothetical protein